MTFDAVIVGAGISGLCLAKSLIAKNWNVIVMEKSKSVGGRIATRRDGLASYDHGAQFYQIPKMGLNEFEKSVIGISSVHRWFENQESHFFAAEGGLTQIAKSLANGVTIQFNEKVLSVTDQNGILSVTLESEKLVATKNIFLSCPLPQSLAILDDSNLTYPASLNAIQYAKALVGLIEVQTNDSNLIDLKYEQNINAHLFSISHQLSKKVGQVAAFTVVMTPSFSQQYFEHAELDSLSKIQAEFGQILQDRGFEFTIAKSQLKKWRYSHPKVFHSKPHEIIGPNKNIFLLGDAFGGPSIAGAVHSAQSLLSEN